MLEAARALGLRVPDDLSIVGYDDIPLARWVSPRLTTVHQPLRRMGEEAARLAIRLADERRSTRRRAWIWRPASWCARARRRRRPGRRGARTATSSRRVRHTAAQGPGCRGLDLDRDTGCSARRVVDERASRP